MPTSNVIDIQLTDLRQFFNSLDPSPFHDKDLDRERLLHRRVAELVPWLQAINA